MRGLRVLWGRLGSAKRWDLAEQGIWAPSPVFIQSRLALLGFCVRCDMEKERIVLLSKCYQSYWAESPGRHSEQREGLSENVWLFHCELSWLLPWKDVFNLKQNKKQNQTLDGNLDTEVDLCNYWLVGNCFSVSGRLFSLFIGRDANPLSVLQSYFKKKIWLELMKGWSSYSHSYGLKVKCARSSTLALIRKASTY